MPWKGIRDPYRIWLSEIILQQTRVEQGRPYYERFVEQYPDVTALAQAPDEAVMKLWEGLGYYSRARNLLQAARYVAHELGGRFPDTYEGLRQLKGVGDYTAAAIASFAYGLPHAVLDGNVFRVLSRYSAIETPIHLPEAKKQFSRLANDLLPPDRAAEYNQAIMDFGALVCTPRKPACSSCPVQAHCQAFLQELTDFFPVKKSAAPRRTRFFYYLLLEEGEFTYVEKRAGKDIWAGLWQFPLIETDVFMEGEPFLDSAVYRNWLSDHGAEPVSQKIISTSKHLLTHREIVLTFVAVRLQTHLNAENKKYIRMFAKKVGDLTLPKPLKMVFIGRSQILTFF